MFVCLLFYNVGKSRKNNRKQSYGILVVLRRIIFIDANNHVVVDLDSIVPFEDSFVGNSGIFPVSFLLLIDSLQSIQIEPKVLDFSEKPVCMQWANVFLFRHSIFF